MHICRYYHDETLPEPVRSALEETLHDSLVAPHEPDEGSEVPTRGADPLRATVRRLAGTITFGALTAGNERLSERIAHEAVHWVGHRWAELEAEDPFAAEERALDASAGPGTESHAMVALPAPASTPDARLGELASTVRSHRPELDRLCSTAVHSLPDAGPGRDRLDIEARARMRLLHGAWRERLEADRLRHRERLLGRALGGYIRELEALVPGLAERQAAVRDLLGDEDALWDLDPGAWTELPLDGLVQTAAELERHPEIVRLAAILGRSRLVTERRTRTEQVREVRRRVVGIGKSEVAGVTAGDDLTSLLASEAELLAREETEDLFYAKLARKELLVLDYRRERVSEVPVMRPVTVCEEVTTPRGPVVVCVDTSGSMLGRPELVAKAIVLALARRLAVDGRRVEVIAFSSGVRSFTMTPGDLALPGLLSFLSGGFHGGTDLRAALEAAVAALERNGWRHADVLVVSDFRVPKIADRFAARFREQGRRGTLFHSLTVARGPVEDPLNLFDTSWLFDLKQGRIAADTLRAL